MRTREISHDQWQPFFNEFTELHRDEHVDVERIVEGASEVESRLCDLPLVGIVSSDPKPGKEEWIEVIARDTSGAPSNQLLSTSTLFVLCLIVRSEP